VPFSLQYISIKQILVWMSRHETCDSFKATTSTWLYSNFTFYFVWSFLRHLIRVYSILGKLACSLH